MESRSFFRNHHWSKSLQYTLALFFVCSVLLAPHSAQATGATLKRSVSNILMAPFDIVTAPITSVRILVNGFQTQDDSNLKRAVYVVPGFVFLNLLEAGGAVIREVSGLLELAPGIVLVVSKSDLRPLFAPPEQAVALLDQDIVVLRLKFGIDYTNTLLGGRQGEDFGKPTDTGSDTEKDLPAENEAEEKE